MIKNKISYTALSKYIDCPELFRLHYKEKLRSTKLPSPLIFGSAVDKAITHLLENKDLNKALQMFDNAWKRTIDVNGNEISTFNHSDIEYRYTDLDEDLLTKEELESECPQWWSLYHKGNILIKSYSEQVLPRIKRVLGTQIDIELVNKDGDSVIGKCDYVIEWENGEIHACDFKTSAMMYAKESVQKSTQLAIYDVALKETFKVDKCAYHVGSKNINKNKIKTCSICGFDGSGTQFKTCNNKRNNGRCNGEWNVVIDPKAYYQIIIDNIDSIFKQSTIDNLNEINFAVKNSIFFKNFKNCETKMGKCVYWSLCHNHSMENLVKK